MSGVVRHAVTADHVFDGAALRDDIAVVVEGARIVELVPRDRLPKGVSTYHVPTGAWLAPGFIDVQVNGGGDVLFNDDFTPAGLSAIIVAHRKFGTTALLPTLITDSDEKMVAARDSVQAVLGSEPGVLGIHFEGPFLSPEKPGVHSRDFLRSPMPDDFELLAGLRGGVTLVTLAPEQVPAGFIARLTAAGVKVSLGHSMATYAQTRIALAQGATGFTHLFNAMRPLASREPGPIAAALDETNAYYGLIVDGHHVDPVMLRLALRGRGHPMLVTDAMPPVGGNRSSFALYGDEITVRDNRCTRGDGTLAGSAIDMATAVRNCVRLLRVPLEQALRFASAEPAQFLGLGDRLGALAPGFRADMVAFQPDDVNVFATWVAGRSSA